MIGFRIHTQSRRVSAQVIEAFRGVPVANISDVMARMSAGGARLRPMHGGAFLSGAALTVRTRPGDNLMVHKALQMAQAGDVLVVDAGGDLTNAIIGELMIMRAQKRGVAGVVINGAVRDSAFIRQHDFPVYAAGVTHRGPYRDGPGEINVAVSFDGMVIEPGDLIVGDADGLLCVPYAMTDAVLQAAKNKHAGEEKSVADIAAGTLDLSWIDVRLKALGCGGV